MKILVACEWSARVREAFRARGHDAWSCDFYPSDVPGQHIVDNVLNHLDERWDMMIAFPPCTYLSNLNNAHLAGNPARWEQRDDAVNFFLRLWEAPIPKIAIENPVGVMSILLRKPDQIIEPFFFGDPFKKRTCLWLKNLPLLKRTSPPVDRATLPAWVDGGPRSRGIYNNSSDSQMRGKTFQGIANTMAEQWG